MKKVFVLVTITALLISCKSENKKEETAPDKTLTEKIADEAGKIISEVSLGFCFFPFMGCFTGKDKRKLKSF